MRHAGFVQIDSFRIGYHLVLGFRLFVCSRFVAVW